MSQKTTRRTTQMQTTVVSTSTPIQEAVVNARSPFSPTCLSRQDEKNKLQHLNDRLAQYIDRVRSLEVENQRLNVMVRSSDEKMERTCSDIKSTYCKELSDVKRIVDELTRKKTMLTMELDKKVAAYDALTSAHDELLSNYNEAEKKLDRLEAALAKTGQDMRDALAKSKNAAAENKKLKDENRTLSDQLAKLRANSERDAMALVDLKSEVSSLRDQLALENSVHSKELTAARSSRETVVTEINEQLVSEYKQRMHEELALMRQDFEARIRLSRTEVESMYEKKLADIRSASDGNLEKKHAIEGELKRIQSQIAIFESERNKWMADVQTAQKALSDLEKISQRQKDDFHARMVAKDGEIEHLRQEISQMMVEYKDLMDLKVSMAAELDAYRHMLEGEEKRLNLSPKSESEDESLLLRRPAKRRRLWYSSKTEEPETVSIVDEDNVGDLKITNHDAVGGHSVTLKNLGKEDVCLGGWILSHVAGKQEVSYKFHPKFVLKGDKQVTVWSSDCNVEHHPPSDLVMKNQKWPFGATEVQSTLFNVEGDTVAWRKTAAEVRTAANGGSNGSCFIM